SPHVRIALRHQRSQIALPRISRIDRQAPYRSSAIPSSPFLQGTSARREVVGGSGRGRRTCGNSIVYNHGGMKLAILGTRGIPANYGGFETFAEELSTRLVSRGHDVTVYGRSNNIRYREPTYKGVKLTILPTIGTKYLDTVVHTFLSVLHAVVRKRFDCVLMCNAANAIFAFVPR